MTVTEPATVLVVDDTPQNVRLLEAVLTPKGYTVTSASSGEEALAMVRQQQPDLILLDVVFLFFVVFFWVSGNEGIGSDHAIRNFGVPFGTYFVHGQSYAHGRRTPVSPKQNIRYYAWLACAFSADTRIVRLPSAPRLSRSGRP